MVHPDTYTDTTDKGISLFAKRGFRKGEIIWLADKTDTLLAASTYNSFTELQKRKINPLGYLDSRGRFVMPGDDGRYVNHSCAPNCTYLLEFDNISVAKRDIRAGEEITENYRCYHGHLESFECGCGAAECIGFLDSGLPFSPSLRLSFNSIAGLVSKYQQPLLDMDFECKREFMAALNKQPHGFDKSQTFFARLGHYLQMELGRTAVTH